MMEKGGSSVDAAIATLFCNGVVHPDTMGIGGGVIFNIYDRNTRRATIIDGREVAPASSEHTPMVCNLLETGPLSIAVPGELRAYEEAHKRFGKLSWKDLVQPAIELCRNGFNVSNNLATKLAKNEKAIGASQALKEQFFHPTENRLFHEGETMFCGPLAFTLESIREGGVSEFYEGSVGRQLIEDIQRQGGTLKLEDLSNYKARVRSPVESSLPLRGVTLFAPPAPASGEILSLILRIMDGFDQSPTDAEGLETASLMNHRLVEALKFASAAKTHLADEDFLMKRELLRKIASSEFANEIRARIDNVTHSPEYYSPASPLPEDSGTSHVSVLSSDGLAVSVTSSINEQFGSRILSPKTGILLNNHMADFSARGLPNGVEAGKRPMSSMVPAIVVNTETLQPVLVLGGAGHTRITSGVAQVAFRHLYLGASVKESIDSPRLHHQLSPNTLYYQEGFPGVLRRELALRGHEIELDQELSAFSAISAGEDGLHANADYRRGGTSVAGA
ncbi:glutathione hydrolase 1 proenzyme [Galendromus occidentalis]|uniref:Glutathione hydrolase 1 proenzyme n=1 Tax=Galendromus occidentalis TaxID=34638 RepID=A0AAJ7SHI7_9ACAR|nr:glutathione hydrolase 1 proenzyme [Galendromus occidentalis]